MNMRESFEAWEDNAGNATPNIRCKLKGFEHEYADTAKQDRWQAWKASRAAIVLPESTGGYIAGEYGNGYADALHEVKQAIGVDVP